MVAAPFAPTAPRAAIYVRVSSQQQEREGTSLEPQEAACRRFCTERGYLLADATE
jgi:site-specific DNA recombinase